MKKVILLILSSFVLSGCVQSEKRSDEASYRHTIKIKAYDVAKQWDSVPVIIYITPAMEDGDVLVLKHRKNEVAKVVVKGDLGIKKLSLRIRTLGSGKIVASLYKPNGSQSTGTKNILVNEYGEIPKYNSATLKAGCKIKKGGIALLVKNDSAKNEYVKKAVFEFDNGHVTFFGSTLLSRNPYFKIHPSTAVGKPKIDVESTNNASAQCHFKAKKEDFDRDLKMKLASDIMLQKLKANGGSLLCDQPKYQECFQESQQECIQEVRQFKSICSEKAKKLVPLMQDINNVENYSKAYLGCLSMNQAMLHPSKIQEIASCMKGLHFERERGIKSLLSGSEDLDEYQKAYKISYKKASGIIRKKNALEKFKKYYSAPNHKAFAQSKAGAWQYVTDRTSREYAVDEALKKCKSHNKKHEESIPCEIVNVNNQWVD